MCSWDSWYTPEVESFSWWHNGKATYLFEEMTALGSGKVLCSPWNFPQREMGEKQWQTDSLEATRTRKHPGKITTTPGDNGIVLLQPWKMWAHPKLPTLLPTGRSTRYECHRNLWEWHWPSPEPGKTSNREIRTPTQPQCLRARLSWAPFRCTSQCLGRMESRFDPTSTENCWCGRVLNEDSRHGL